MHENNAAKIGFFGLTIFKNNAVSDKKYIGLISNTPLLPAAPRHLLHRLLLHRDVRVSCSVG